jgi:hypothetical protein
LLLLVLAWMSSAWALPDDRDARAPRWAAADLACATSDGTVPGCPGKANPASMLGTGGELLREYLKRRPGDAAAARQAPSSIAAGPARAESAQRSSLPPAPPQGDEVTPVIFALRELIAAIGVEPNADTLLAFAGRAAAGAPGGEGLERARKVAAAPSFGALFAWSQSLPAIYQSTGARFNHVLFNAIDARRLIAWNCVTPESAPERPAGGAPIVGSLDGIGPDPDWRYRRVGPQIGSEPDDAADKPPVKKRRVIVYMQSGRTTVMTVEDPPAK